MAEGTAGDEAPRDAVLGEHVHRVDALAEGGHAVIADQQQGRRSPGAARVEPREQAAELAILLLHRLAHLRRVGSVGVALRVGAVPPGEDEARALGGREIEPGEDPVHLLRVGHGLIEGGLAMGCGDALPGGLRPHPEEGRGAHALALGGGPERLGLDPARVVPVVEEAALAVQEGVGHDAVAVRRSAGRDRDVARKGARGEHRHQPVGAQALVGDPGEGRQRIAIQVVVPHAVEGEENHHRELG